MRKDGYVYRYSFDVMGSRRICLDFETVDELRKEVSRYFTRREQNIVQMLTTFPGDAWKNDGHGSEIQKHDYRHYSVIAMRYKEDENG